jgi:adenylosuccinate lyase
MASTAFAEVYEPFVTGRGASSTMPQKRNPISSELMLAASKGVRPQAGLMLDAMVQDFERATGPWHAEWMAIPESFVLAAGALHQAKFALGGQGVQSRSVMVHCRRWGARRKMHYGRSSSQQRPHDATYSSRAPSVERK